jgi:hypothetical protein
VDDNDLLALRIGPQMYEAIREAADFRGPVGQGVAEMSDLRGFYGRLAISRNVGDTLRIADPDAIPPALITVTLPHFIHRLRGAEITVTSAEKTMYDYDELRGLTERPLRIRTAEEEILGTLRAWGDNGLALTVRRGGRSDIVFVRRDQFIAAERINRRRKISND